MLGPSADSPFHRFLLKNITTEWSLKHWQTVWYSPIYEELSSIWDVTMRGIDIQKADEFGGTVKGITVARMMVRGLSLVRTACWAMAIGSPSDVLACYRMVFDRALMLQYLDKMNQYEEFEKFYWARAYFWLADASSSQMWRGQATRTEIQSLKDRQAVIKEKHFDGRVPNKPHTYWQPPSSTALTNSFSLHPLGLPELEVVSCQRPCSVCTTSEAKPFIPVWGI